MPGSRRGDRLAVAALLGIPLLGLGVPALAGHPMLTGDDVVQNFPLEVYAGQVLAHLHLPVYDPYLWSGTPLLAGINAHALFPSEVAFALLPPLAAWVLVEAVTLAAIALGLYTFLRCTGCRPLAAALAGAIFGLGGFVSSQVVHLPFLSGVASFTWALVAVERLAHAPREHAPRWTTLLAVTVALVGLCGSPDAVLPATVSVACLGGWLLAATPGRRRLLLASGGLAVAVGLLLSAVAWLPGADFVAVSQRAHPAPGFLTSGSVSPGNFLLLLLPNLLGGGSIGLHPYVGSYNLPELDAYAGLLPLAAALALAVRFGKPAARRYRVCYLIGALGVLLALGGHTPLEALVSHLPIAGQARLPSRALIMVDLALAALFGYWADELLHLPDAPGRLGRVAELLAPGAALALLAAVGVLGSPVARVAGGPLVGAWSRGAVAAYLGVAGALALIVAGLLVAARRLGPRGRAWGLAGVVVLDLIVFTANQSSLGPTRGVALGRSNPLQARLSALVAGGRFLVVDPTGPRPVTIEELGEPDINVAFRLASVQGYGALTWAPYAAATGTHGEDVSAPATVTPGVARELDLRAVLTTPSQLVTSHPGELHLAAHAREGRYFGRTVRVAAVSLGGPLAGGAGGLSSVAASIRLLGASGVPLSAVPEVLGPDAAGLLRARFPGNPAASGLVVENPTSRATVVRLAVDPARGATFGPGGALSAALAPGTWLPRGQLGGLSAYLDPTVPAGSAGRYRSGTPGARVRVTVLPSAADTPTVRLGVRASRAAWLLRAVADIPGWHASVRYDGVTRALSVHRAGLVQAVRVPAGASVLTFTYAAPGLATGLDLAGIGLVGLLGLAAAGAPRFSRRRRAERGRRHSRDGGARTRPPGF